MEKKILGFYNYTVVLTYIGMLCGFAGIAFVLSGEYFNAVIALMFAGLCDMFDGAVASTKKDRTKQEKTFGIQIDSLSDLICFGVLPGFFVLKLNEMSIVAIIVSACYVLAALIRLAYFNVDEQERQEKTTESRKQFYGCPVTMSALMYPITFGIGQVTKFDVNYLMIGIQAVMAVCFLLAVPLKKPGKFGKIFMICLGIAEIIFIFCIR